jgi:hypothetical protein
MSLGALVREPRHITDSKKWRYPLLCFLSGSFLEGLVLFEV